MRCKACDVLLDDLETLKKDSRGIHYDLCTDCLTVSIAANWELENMAEVDVDDDTGTITQDDVLKLQENYDNIYLSITKDY
tara:strand:- start:290 stop:532 length:243 start_codon:yes stop_codon:yes gene_type:complete